MIEIIEYNPVTNTYTPIIIGGHDFGNLDIFDKPNTVNKQPINSEEIKLFPEDTINDARFKIAAILKLPPNALHLTYNDHLPTYRIIVDDIEEHISMREYLNEEDVLGGVRYDKRFEFMRNCLIVRSREPFISLRSVERIYFTNLSKLITIPLELVALVTSDKFAFDSIYYGFIMKYFPQMSVEDFSKYINGQYDVSNIDQLVAESRILNTIHDRGEEIIQRYPISSASVLSICFQISLKLSHINLHNIFDVIELDNDIISSVITFYHDNKWRVVHKRYKFSSSTITDIPNVPAVVFMMRSGIRFAVYDNQYYISTLWNEEEKISISAAIDVVSRLTEPLIKKINAKSMLIFPYGGKMWTPNNGPYVLSNIIAIGNWESTLSITNIGRTFDELSFAGIIQLKNIQTIGSYAFTFVKGIIDYNIDNIERVLDAEGISNSYQFYGQQNIPYKLINLHHGRDISINQRATNIQIEFQNMTNNELAYIWQYVYLYLDKFAAKINNPQTRVINKLKSLQEHDPELYNLRKHDPNSPVYSVICQNPRPPNILNEVEYDKLSKKDQDGFTKYWNFTLKKPTYYQCALKEFPTLSFLENKHKLGYCIPCCQKAAILVNSKRYKINQICLSKYCFSDDDLNQQIVSKYILSYGKSIPRGRIGQAPKSLSDFVLIGVNQQVSAIPYAGFLFSLAEIVNVPPHKFVESVNLGDNFVNAFINGVVLLPTIDSWEMRLKLAIIKVYGIYIIEHRSAVRRNSRPGN